MHKKLHLTFLFILIGIAGNAGSGKYLVLDYGAKGNGTFNNTKSIQAAIDDCSLNGGGEVYFPDGIYLTGTLLLKDGVILHLSANAVLLGSKEPEDYHWINPTSNYFTNEENLERVLIFSEHADNIAIIGKGEINGNYDAGSRLIENQQNEVKKQYLPKVLVLNNCKHVNIRNITIKKAYDKLLQVKNSENVVIQQASFMDEKNGSILIDGIHMHNNKNLSISNCNFEF